MSPQLSKLKGTLITLRRPEGDLDAARMGSKSAGYERRFVLGVSPLHPEVTVRFWEEIPNWFKRGKLRPSRFKVIKRLDADAVNQALDHYHDGEGVKINIHPWEQSTICTEQYLKVRLLYSVGTL